MRGVRDLSLILGNCSMHCSTSSIHAVVSFSQREKGPLGLNSRQL